MLKFKTQKQKVWFISDFHAKHSKEFILKPRNYTDGESAYESMIKTWNERIGPDDIVFNLGDFVVGAGTRSKEVANELIRRLNGKFHHFLFGNHNAGVKQIYSDCVEAQFGKFDYDIEIYPLSYAGRFIFLGHYSEIVVDGQFIVLTHYPVGSWNEMAKGSWNICGHTHGNYQNSLPNNPDFRQLDVGWEVFGGPIEFSDIKRIMNKKGGKLVDHHGK